MKEPNAPHDRDLLLGDATTMPSLSPADLAKSGLEALTGSLRHVLGERLQSYRKAGPIRLKIASRNRSGKEKQHLP
jgi:hypothetical protein